LRMGISMRTVAWLRQRGHDVVHLREEKLHRLSDESSEVVNERLADVLAQCRTGLDGGAIVSVSEISFRIRRLPI